MITEKMPCIGSVKGNNMIGYAKTPGSSGNVANDNNFGSQFEI